MTQKILGRAKDNNMKIVFLTRFDFTNNVKDGGVAVSYRNYSLIEKKYGKKNIMLCIVTPYKCENKDNIMYFHVALDVAHSYLTYFILKDRIPPKTERKIIKVINNFHADMIFYDGSTFGQFAGKLNSIRNKVIYFHNIERQYTWDQVRKHSPLCIFRYIATRHTERKIVGSSSNRICMNQRDADLLYKYYGVYPNFIFPATFEDSYKEKSIIENRNTKSTRKELLFVGSYVPHNYSGLLWFIKNVLPDIDCSLTIVGNNMERIQEKIKNIKCDSSKLSIRGTVESLEEYYLSADAVVMPIFMGGGMKVKTAEALMYGKTIFASTEALQGYEVEGIRAIFRCDTKEEYINSINSNIVKNSQNKIFNMDVRNLFLEKYCNAAYEDRVSQYLRENIN